MRFQMGSKSFKKIIVIALVLMASLYMAASLMEDEKEKKPPERSKDQVKYSSASTYTLEEAIDKGIVYAEFYGMGASSGESVAMGIERRSSGPVTINVARGMVLKASSASAQDMLVRGVSKQAVGTGDEITLKPVSSIELNDYEPQVFILDAYCMNFEKDNPGEDISFSVGTTKDPELQKVLSAVDSLSEETTDITSVQTAIWVVTDDVSKEELQSKFDVDQTNLDNARVILQVAGINTASKQLFA